MTFLSLVLYVQKRNGQGGDDAQPLDITLIAWFSLVFVFLISLWFIYLSESKFSVDNNIGQIGDFIGGLTNPVLSFLALLVLLRTTSIQTAEAKKTTAFMEKQQEILEREKFENTFFQLLERLESYCDVHLRVKSGTSGMTVAEAVSVTITGSNAAFSVLPPLGQLRSVKKLIRSHAHNDTWLGFYYRAVRVLKFINSSKLPKGWRRSYAALLRDTMHPHERIVLLNYSFSFQKYWRTLLQKWEVTHVKSRWYSSAIIARFYEDKTKAA
jgi:hypothetical protein